MRVLALVVPTLLVLSGIASAEKVELVTGGTLEGEIVEETEEVVVMEHPVLGRLEIPVEQIKPKVTVKPGIGDSWFLRGWNRSFSFGYAGSSGKTKQTNLNTDLDLTYKSDRNRVTLDFRYYYSREDGNTSNHESDALYIHDFLIPDHNWFPFISAAYRFDQKQEWNHRLGGNAGFGYTFIDDATWKAIGRLGGGIARTFTDDRPVNSTTGQKEGSDPVRWEPNMLIATQLGWVIMEGMSVTWNTAYSLDFADLPNFRLTSRAEYKIAIGYIDGLGIKTGISYIYDAHESTSARNDRKWYVNVVYDF